MSTSILPPSLVLLFAPLPALILFLPQTKSAVALTRSPAFLQTLLLGTTKSHSSPSLLHTPLHSRLYLLCNRAVPMPSLEQSFVCSNTSQYLPANTHTPSYSHLLLLKSPSSCPLPSPSRLLPPLSATSWLARRLACVGGSALLAETDELIGAEGYVLDKCRDYGTCTT